MRCHRTLIPSLLLLTSAPALADSFDIQGGLRKAHGQDWKGGEFMIHYLSEDIHSFSFGAYFSSSAWLTPKSKKALNLEGGPEIRYQVDEEKRTWFGAMQYASLSNGTVQADHSIGIRIYGPRLIAGVILPFDNGVIFNAGLMKGFETITFHGDTQSQADFSSFGAFIGFGL